MHLRTFSYCARGRSELHRLLAINLKALLSLCPGTSTVGCLETLRQFFAALCHMDHNLDGWWRRSGGWRTMIVLRITESEELSLINSCAAKGGSWAIAHDDRVDVRWEPFASDGPLPTHACSPLDFDENNWIEHSALYLEYQGPGDGLTMHLGGLAGWHKSTWLLRRIWLL